MENLQLTSSIRRKWELNKVSDWLDRNMYGQAKHQPRSNVLYGL
ncbi:hypothetical protein MTR67_005041 [Solanum verrucosum]|uniref:Uncharacterized protein n=1 Tax=Solanum verrucosum TaxID=315347 RepID=A0AAF0PVM2_SOLVR|nr:hypothetical protein MTR67_005041 [Solanum verrucosum]